MPELTATNQEISDANEGLKAVGARDYEDPKTRYWLNKLIRAVRREAEALGETMQDGINRFGAKDEKGNLIPQGNGFKLEDGVGYRAWMKTLMAETVTLTGVRQMTMKELTVVKGTGNELALLGPFVDDVEP